MANTAPRVFEFTTVFSMPIPKEALAPKKPRADNENALPFKEWFTANMQAADEGKQPAVFVPSAYWTEERKNDPAKTSPEIRMGKLRDQFKAWQAETKVVTVPQVREPNTKDANGKIVKMGKVTTEEVSTNEARGGYFLIAMARNGKEPKDVFPSGKPEAGVMLWLDSAKGKAAREAQQPPA